MLDPIQILWQAIAADPSNVVYRWDELDDAMRAVISGPHTAEAEQLLLAILRFDGQLRLKQKVNRPNVLAPRELLQVLAIQTLARWTGTTYRCDFERVAIAASSSALAAIVVVALQKCKAV